VSGVGLGASSTCLLRIDGTAWCAGNNMSGQLGTTAAAQPCDNGVCSSTFLPSAGGRLFKRLAVGALHVCGLTPTGEAWCWGAAHFGQLGDDPGSDAATDAIPVKGDLRFSSLAAGSISTCGLTIDGSLHCWGVHGYKPGGIGPDFSERFTVTRVATPERLTSLASGPSHTCGLTVEGVALCWGLNDHGQLGRSVGEPCEPRGPANCGTTPAAVLTSLRFTALTLGRSHTCGLTLDGLVYCWGGNGVGQLGDGTTMNSMTPRRVTGLQ
jgi:alpha-tubulin suppressor-like RCC1 family protein